MELEGLMPLYADEKRFPGFVSGTVLMPLAPIPSTGASAVPAVDKVYLYPFVLFESVLVKQLGGRVVTGGAASSAKQGIWANSLVSNRPLGAPLIAANTGQATTGSGTNISEDTTDAYLGPGWYWAGSKYTGTLPAMQSIAVAAGQFRYFMGSANGPLDTGLSYDDAYANDMPTIAEGATFATVAASGVPLLSFSI